MTLAEAIESRGCACFGMYKGSNFGSSGHSNSCPIQIAADLRSGALGQEQEPKDSLLVGAESPPREAWAMVALKGQHVVRMTPKHFPFMGSWEETVDRARIYPAVNPAFKQRWSGYKLVGCRIDGEVEV